MQPELTTAKPPVVATMKWSLPPATGEGLAVLGVLGDLVDGEALIASIARPPRLLRRHINRWQRTKNA